MAGTRLVVTGAGGWIGRALVSQARAAGVQVCGYAGLQAGQLLPADMLREATVVHLAAIAHRKSKDIAPADYQRVNADWPAQLAAQARRCGSRRLIVLSSAAVMGSCSIRPWHECDVPAPQDDYARAKLQAEHRVLGLHEPGRFEVCVLRPPLVWGPGVRANFLALLRAADSPWPLPLAQATAPRSMVYLANLIAAVLHVAVSPQAAGRVFFVRDETDWSVSEWLSQIRQARQRAPRLWAVPRSWWAAALASLGRQALYERLWMPAQVDDAALRATGWQPPMAMHEGLQATLAWYMQRLG